MNTPEIVIYVIAGFLTSIMSGIVGAGGGFIMTPLSIFLGLTPAQAVSTGKLSGLSTTLGSLSGLRKSKEKVHYSRILPVMMIALAIGLLTPLVITSMDGDVYRKSLGIILLLMIPVVIYKKVGVKPHHPKPWQKIIGNGLLAVALFLQGVFSGGLGTLVNLVLMGMLGMSAIEANITKRWSQLVLNTTIIFGVLGSGLILWHIAFIGIFVTFVGSYIGGRLATKKGDQFIMNTMIGLMIVSAIFLIVG